MDPIATLVFVLLGALTVAALLNWTFEGEIRHLMVASFPERMLAGCPRSKLLLMTQEELTMFICGASDLPMFFRKLLTCPRCMSAHLSAFATLLALMTGLYWPVAPLVWAASAWLGYKLFLTAK